MKMAWLTILLGLTLMVTSTDCVSLSNILPDEARHLEVCYIDSDMFSRAYRMGQSLDNLLALIEKVERHHSFRSRALGDVAGYLMIRFRLDGIYKVTRTVGLEPYARDDEQKLKGDTIKKIYLKTWGSWLYFQEPRPEDVLTNEERCALHWMISHSVNRTLRDDENRVFPTPKTYLKERRKRQDTSRSYLHEVSRFPTESGIIRTDYGTVAAGPVLAGLSVVDLAPHQLIRPLEELNADIYESYRKRPMKLLDAMTYGGIEGRTNFPSRYRCYQYFQFAQRVCPRETARTQVSSNLIKSTAVNLAFAAKHAANGEVSYLGPRGWWNCSYCPSEYILEYEHTSVTDAEIFGGFDGFLLGQGLIRMTNRVGLKLSQALRMYYGNGFQINRDLRACLRFTKISEWCGQALGLGPKGSQDEIASAILLLNQVPTLPGTVNRTRTVLVKLASNYTSVNFQAMPQCAAKLGESEKVTKPVVDLYVVTDGSQYFDPVSYEEQASIIGELANYMDISQYTSHIGVYVNDAKQTEKILPMNKTMSEAEFKCRLKNLPIDILDRLRPNPLLTIENLHTMFSTMKRDEVHFVASPAKVLLFMQRNRPSVDENQLKWRMMEFRRDHPDITILAFGRVRGSLEAYVRYGTDIITELAGLSPAEIALPIYDKLKKIGSSLYFPFCDQDISQHHTNQFMIGPGERRYHTMISQYFNSSKDFRIEIQGLGFPLKICHSRSSEIFTNPLTAESTCQQVSAVGSTPVTFLFPEPCLEYKGTHCPEIHLMVESVEPVDIIPVCVDDACSTADMMRYTINLHNAHCGAGSLRVSVILLTISLLFQYFHKS